MTPAELLTHRARAQAAQLAAEVTACTILLGLHRLAVTVTAGWN